MSDDEKIGIKFKDRWDVAGESQECAMDFAIVDGELQGVTENENYNPGIAARCIDIQRDIDKLSTLIAGSKSCKP
jgi:hypothetical protein